MVKDSAKSMSTVSVFVVLHLKLSDFSNHTTRSKKPDKNALPFHMVGKLAVLCKFSSTTVSGCCFIRICEMWAQSEQGGIFTGGICWI